MGACVLGDIGEYFPSDDPAMRGVDSMHLLGRAQAMAASDGWRIVHADVTVIAEEVRVAPHREAIVANLTDVLVADYGTVSVKATSTDGLGFVGAGNGIAVVAVVTIEAIPNIDP